MKRQIALLCALLLLFSFAVSCGKTEAEPEDVVEDFAAYIKKIGDMYT